MHRSIWGQFRQMDPQGAISVFLEGILGLNLVMKLVSCSTVTEAVSNPNVKPGSALTYSTHHRCSTGK